MAESDVANEVLNTSTSNVASSTHTGLQSVLQSSTNVVNASQKEEGNKHSFIDKLQISPEMQKGMTDSANHDAKKEITSLNLNQDSIQVSHVA